MVSFFSISYIRLHFTHSLSFQFVAMVAHLLHFVKHVKIKRFSHMRRPIHLTVPLDKNVESRRALSSTGAVIASQGTRLVLNSSFTVSMFYSFVIFYLYSYTICGVVLPRPSRGSAIPVQPLRSRHWLSACAVGTLQDPCRLCRCVTIRCNNCQSYSINTIVCCPCSS